VVSAQILLKGDMLQPLYPLAQRMFLVGLPEKTRVVEAGSQHALMPMPDDALGIAVSIQHREKMGKQFAISIFNREIFLMVTHDRDQYFLRQFQKFPVKAAQYR